MTGKLPPNVMPPVPDGPTQWVTRHVILAPTLFALAIGIVVGAVGSYGSDPERAWVLASAIAIGVWIFSSVLWRWSRRYYEKCEAQRRRLLGEEEIAKIPMAAAARSSALRRRWRYASLVLVAAGVLGSLILGYFVIAGIGASFVLSAFIAYRRIDARERSEGERSR